MRLTGQSKTAALRLCRQRIDLALSLSRRLSSCVRPGGLSAVLPLRRRRRPAFPLAFREFAKAVVKQLSLVVFRRGTRESCPSSIISCSSSCPARLRARSVHVPACARSLYGRPRTAARPCGSYGRLVRVHETYVRLFTEQQRFTADDSVLSIVAAPQWSPGVPREQPSQPARPWRSSPPAWHIPARTDARAVDWTGLAKGWKPGRGCRRSQHGRLQTLEAE
jgi:hypothetical protein